MARGERGGGLKDLGLEIPEMLKASQVSFRLSGLDMRKLDALARGANVGRSKLARLIVEKFIAEHDPERKGRR
jgi:hypothetical protein